MRLWEESPAQSMAWKALQVETQVSLAEVILSFIPNIHSHGMASWLQPATDSCLSPHPDTTIPSPLTSRNEITFSKVSLLALCSLATPFQTTRGNCSRQDRPRYAAVTVDPPNALLLTVGLFHSCAPIQLRPWLHVPTCKTQSPPQGRGKRHLEHGLPAVKWSSPETVTAVVSVLNSLGRTGHATLPSAEGLVNAEGLGSEALCCTLSAERILALDGILEMIKFDLHVP